MTLEKYVELYKDYFDYIGNVFMLETLFGPAIFHVYQPIYAVTQQN